MLANREYACKRVEKQMRAEAQRETMSKEAITDELATKRTIAFEMGGIAKDKARLDAAEANDKARLDAANAKKGVQDKAQDKRDMKQKALEDRHAQDLAAHTLLGNDAERSPESENAMLDEDKMVAEDRPPANAHAQSNELGSPTVGSNKRTLVFNTSSQERTKKQQVSETQVGTDGVKINQGELDKRQVCPHSIDVYYFSDAPPLEERALQSGGAVAAFFDISLC